MEFHELFSLMEQHDKNSEVLSRFGNNATPVCSCKLKKQNSPSQFSTETTCTGRIPTKMINFEMYKCWPFEKIKFLLFSHTNFASAETGKMLDVACEFA